ncbi:hypothetical protein HUG15_04275 [Salicibibacter cibarius]|uniref:Uncharacterized protein n=1 Tax=Salicibibacter cibarius TaxID=2743000 RepID=A0A7T6Z0T2_9BACI|nr:hypothetical protein [Salicibibacter cibarius]QQK74895.1 hypothetical protein HUG15_04275 [Salicibibacter cibarius]
METLRNWLRGITILLGIIIVGRYLIGIPAIPEPFATLMLFILIMFSGATIFIDRKIKKEKQQASDIFE